MQFFFTDATKRLMLQNIMSGLSSASMIAAAQSNATNLLAASQSSGMYCFFFSIAFSFICVKEN